MDIATVKNMTLPVYEEVESDRKQVSSPAWNRASHRGEEINIQCLLNARHLLSTLHVSLPAVFTVMLQQKLLLILI